MKQQVLIVEDEVKLADLLADYIEHAGYCPTTMYTGDQVVTWVQDNQPAMVLLDLMLPGMMGLKSAKPYVSFPMCRLLC